MSKRIRNTLIAFGSLVFLALLYLWNFPPGPGEGQREFVQFLGRFHPVVLHLPIGLVSLLIILEILCVVQPKQNWRPAANLTLGLATLSALLAIATGMLLAFGSGATEELAINHMRSGLLLGMSLLVLCGLKLLAVAKAQAFLYRAGVLWTCLLMAYASHQGGSITHGRDYLTKHMPNAMRPLFGLERNEVKIVLSKDELRIYDHVVHPILEQKCVSCHNEDKRKGELDMKAYASLLVGGESGPSVRPNDLLHSVLYERVTLPSSDEKFMPPDDKPPLSEIEIRVIAWWIENGAKEDVTYSNMGYVDDTMAAFVDSVFAERLSPKERERIEAARVELYASLGDLRERTGLNIEPLEGRSREFALSAYSVSKQVEDSLLRELEPYADSFVRADLSRTAISDASVSSLARFSKLKSLSLAYTQLSGTTLGALAELPNLEDLNLFGAALGPSSVEELAKLRQLKKLYVGQTALQSEAELSRLKESLPQCEIL